MQISYSLEEDDLISLAEFQLERSGALRKRVRSRRIIYPLSFGFLALGSLLMADNLILPLMFGSMALISFFLAPSFYTWLARRRLPQIVKSKMSSTSIGHRSVSASEKGLHQRVGELYSEVPWNLVHEVAEIPNHVFVAIDGFFSLIIPKRETDGVELNRFVKLLREKIDPADA